VTNGIAGLIPVRGFTTGKTRLADTLPVETRASIMQWMLGGVVSAALESGVLSELLVISPDTSVLAFARSLDHRVVPIIQRDDAPGLNPAVTVGRDLAAARSASGLLVLFADLPFLTAGDVAAIVEEPAGVVVASDRHRTGTNASLVRFAGRGQKFTYQYGRDSARRHAHEAARRGLTFATIQRPGTEFDLDTPGDWREFTASSHLDGRLPTLVEQSSGEGRGMMAGAGEQA
jgi:2-phospho-L-lactate guanylyltransferase